jgi:hypothetical protein
VKLVKAFRNSGVLELVEDHDGRTHCVVYILRRSSDVYVLRVLEEVPEGDSDSETRRGTPAGVVPCG